MYKLKSLVLGAFVAIMACGNATADMTDYTLTFEGRWTSNLARPGGAHFSPFIGSTHQAGGGFMAVGQTASTGVENVAEIGSTTALASEINTAIGAGVANSLITRGGNIGPVEIFSIDITVDSNFSLLSFITMIAPSPDWFVGVHDLDLRSNGQWIQQMTLDLNSYDAGTENGTGFSTSNTPTVPQGVITALDVAEPTNPLFGDGSIARVTLVRAVPEPGSLTGLTLGGMLVCVRRKRRS